MLIALPPITENLFLALRKEAKGNDPNPRCINTLPHAQIRDEVGPIFAGLPESLTKRKNPTVPGSVCLPKLRNEVRPVATGLSQN